jgi:type VII secretion protein EccB
MSSKKDLVEAHSFNRRRLITAFVSGAPGGREVEPVRYGRTLVGGLVLALLVVVGAAVAPLLKPSLPDDWNKKGLVVGKESGSRFVAFDKTLYPVINTTSARLILGTEGDFDVNFVPDDEIAKQKQGDTIGIPGAPDLLPTPAKLLQTGWVACTGTGQGITIGLSSGRSVAPRPDDGFVVSTAGDDTTYVIAGDHRYAVAGGARGDATLRALGLDGSAATPVPGLWLDLITPGKPLTPFALDGAGDADDTGVEGLDTIGTPVKVDGRPYVLSRKGLLPLSDFAYTLYRSSGIGAELSELEVRSGEVAQVRTVNDASQRPYPTDWPDQAVTPFDRSDAPCLTLTTDRETAATVQLAAPLSDSPVAGSGIVRTVESGHGALVQATSGGVIGSGTIFLVDSTGTRYAVGTKSDPTSALTALGYQGERPMPVPSTWMELFGDGPGLTSQAATRAAGGQS